MLRLTEYQIHEGDVRCAKKGSHAKMRSQGDFRFATLTNGKGEELMMLHGVPAKQAKGEKGIWTACRPKGPVVFVKGHKNASFSDLHSAFLEKRKRRRNKDKLKEKKKEEEKKH